MSRTNLYILAFFIMLINYSCSSGEVSEEAKKVHEHDTPTNPGERQEADYPDYFVDLGVSQFEDSFVLHTKTLNNKKGKFGMQIREETMDDFDSVVEFFLTDLVKNNWQREEERDKKSTPEEENDDPPLKYVVTNFKKGKYLLMVNVTTMGDKRTSITKIIKEM